MLLFIIRTTNKNILNRFINNYYKDHKDQVINKNYYKKVLFGTEFIKEKENNKLNNFINNIIEFRFSNKLEWSVYASNDIEIEQYKDLLELSKKYKVNYVFITIKPSNKKDLIRYNKTQIDF